MPPGRTLASSMPRGMLFMARKIISNRCDLWLDRLNTDGVFQTDRGPQG